jgi:hypothetical protein
MNVQTLQYSESAGFSGPIRRQLDSERTLVLVFASPEFDRNIAPLEAAAAAYPKSVVVGCSTAGEIVGTRVSDHSLSIAISCVGRRLVLGERTEEEIEATLDALPFGSHQVGFYSYGELCPQNGASCCELHNQTMTITTISERN